MHSPREQLLKKTKLDLLRVNQTMKTELNKDPFADKDDAKPI
jgi:hypothetical protein